MFLILMDKSQHENLCVDSYVVCVLNMHYFLVMLVHNSWCVKHVLLLLPGYVDVKCVAVYLLYMLD